MYGSIAPGHPATAFRCPRFSATGSPRPAQSTSSRPLKDGVVKCGSPNHAAGRGEKSSGLPRPRPLASRAYSAQATIRPTDQQSLQHPAGKYRHYADAEHS